MLIVTGGSGLLGSQILLNAARKGNMSLRGIYRNPKSLETVKTSYIAQGAKDKFESIEWVQADLIDAFETEEAIKGAKYIIHCAAFVSFNSSDADSMLTVNPEISENVWSAAIKNKIIHGVHVSSISTFSYNPNEDYTNEKSETKPGSLSPYGKSKWASELIAWKYQAEGLSLSTVSPSVIIGCPAWENGTSLIPKKINKRANETPNKIAAVEVAGQLSGPIGMVLVACLILVTTMNSTNSSILMSARMLYAMARDKTFFKQAESVHPRYNTPDKALFIQAAWAVLLVFSGSFDQLTDMLVFAAFLFYAATAVGLLYLRIKLPNAERTYKVIGYPVVPILFLLFCITICVMTLINQPYEAMMGLVLIASGLPVYFWLGRAK